MIAHQVKACQAIKKTV